jgi:hypothetical protein
MKGMDTHEGKCHKQEHFQGQIADILSVTALLFSTPFSPEKSM